MQLLKLLRTTDRILRARFHFWMGRFWLMAGRRARAEREFREVLSKVGEDFQASVYLGRLALEAGDLPGALREMSAARRHSPARFARLRAEIWQRLPAPALRRKGHSARAGSTAGPSVPPAAASVTPAEEPGLRETDPWRKDAEVPLPQFYYWQSTPDSFDFESGQRAASDGHAADLEGTGFHGLPVSSSGNAGGREDGGANQNPEPSGDPLGEGNADNWLFGDGFFRDERSDDSPWTDFLSHHYFFDSLPQDPDSEEYPDGEDDPDYDALGEDLFDFLSEEESEALSPWSEQGSPQDLQGEEDQYLRSPLAGFYEELEEARKEAEGIDADAPRDEDDEDEESAPEAPGKGRPQKSDHDRFEGMPPIEASDLGSVDWDDLLGKLRGDAADPS